MASFYDTDELYSVMEELWKQIKADTAMTSQLLQSKLIVRFKYRHPDGYLTVDASDGKELKIHAGECSLQPTVELAMNSEVAHNFWMGKENPAIALLQGKITSKGPVNKALALLPAIKPAFSIYPKVFQQHKSKAA